MKLIKIIILLSVFLGFSSVYAQTSNTETNKNNEINTEQVNPEIQTASQPQMLHAGEENPATAKVPETYSQKQKIVYEKTGPYPSELDAAQLQQAESKSNQVITKDNRSEQPFSPANPDPNKKNLNVKNNDYD